MATFPALEQTRVTQIEIQGDHRVDYSANGKPHVRIFGGSEKKRINVVIISDAVGWASVNTFYEANSGVPFTFTYDGDGSTSTYVFEGRPSRNVLVDGTYMITVRMQEQ
jgi:hypothetical protein